MPKQGRNYGPKKFKNARVAYSQYQKDRLSDTTNPALAPRDKFINIWGWGSTPGKRARQGLVLGKRG